MNENSGSSGAAENNKLIPKRVDSVDDAVDQMKILLIELILSIRV